MATMVSLLCTLICFAICHIATCQDTSQDGTRCTTQNECPFGMCCVHNPLSQPEARKRFIFEQYAQHDHGYCRKARKFNESCWPLGHDGSNSKLYEFFCPCESGLDCRGLVVHESNNQIIHRYPVCQSPEANLVDSGPTPSGRVCTSDTECLPGMCCVSHPLTAKRQTADKHGYCRNEKKLNETCDIQAFLIARCLRRQENRDVSVPDTLTHDFQCQCQAGLECRGVKVHHFGQQTVHENTICQKPLS